MTDKQFEKIIDTLEKIEKHLGWIVLLLFFVMIGTCNK